MLGLAQFHFDRKDVMKPWSISTQDGAVRLEFQPLGLHKEVMQAGIAASNFKQVFGYFKGTLTLDGHSHPVQKLYGFVEDQYVKW